MFSWIDLNGECRSCGQTGEIRGWSREGEWRFISDAFVEVAAAQGGKSRPMFQCTRCGSSHVTVTQSGRRAGPKTAA